MSLIASLFETRTHPSNPADWFLNLFRQPTAAGVDVTPQTSLQLSAVFACTRVISETVGMLPLILYERLERGKRRAEGLPLYNVLRHLPNPEMTSMELRETLTGHKCQWGNAYAEIEYDGGGRTVGLWPLRADKMQVARINGKLRYVITMPKGPKVELPAYRVMHLRGLSYDGVVGYSPLDLARESIALGLATQEFGARFFKNGATLGVVYQHPSKLSDKAYTRLEKWIEKRHQGLSNAHRISILEEGMEAKTVGIPPENAQFLETRKFQIEEIARWYRMPLHKIQSMDRATFNNIEHQAIEFVIDTIQPWLIRWEQAIYRDLLLPGERQRYFAEHLIEALLRGDTKSRYEAYAIGRQNGFLNGNDIREKENMNPYEGGDIYWMPANMLPADMAGQNGAGDQGDGTQGSRTQQSAEQRALFIERRAQQIASGRQRLAASYERIILDVIERIIRREVNDVRRAAHKYFGKRDAQQFSQWLKEFYEEHREFWQRQILPVLLSYAEQIGVSVADELGGDPSGADDIRAFIDAFVEKLARRQVGESIGQLQTLLDEAVNEGQDPVEALEARLDAWEETRPARAAHKETYYANNALALAFYTFSGITVKRWVTRGGNCPFCDALSGQEIDIRKFFLEKNVDFQPEGAEAPLRVGTNIGHPPAHGGCDCMVIAGR